MQGSVDGLRGAGGRGDCSLLRSEGTHKSCQPCEQDHVLRLASYSELSTLSSNFLEQMIKAQTLYKTATQHGVVSDLASMSAIEVTNSQSNARPLMAGRYFGL